MKHLKKTVFPHARELNFRQGGGPLGGPSEVLRRARGRCTTPRAWTPGFEPAGTCGCLFFPYDTGGMAALAWKWAARRVLDQDSGAGGPLSRPGMCGGGRGHCGGALGGPLEASSLGWESFRGMPTGTPKDGLVMFSGWRTRRVASLFFLHCAVAKAISEAMRGHVRS